MGDSTSNKVIGYSLLLIGLLMISYSVFNIIQVFTAKAPYYKLFNFDAITMDLSSFIPGAPASAALTQELVSSDLISQPLNLFAHLLLMGFIATAGQKIASIGVMLIRTIKVNLKEEKSVLFPPR